MTTYIRRDTYMALKRKLPDMGEQSSATLSKDLLARWITEKVGASGI